MHCQQLLFVAFLIIYTVTGLALAVVGIILHNTNLNKNQSTPHLSLPGQYYIDAVSVYILMTCVFYLIARIFYKTKVVAFRLAIILLALGMLIQATATAIIVLLGSGIDSNTKKATSIIICSLTAYLFVLQIYGIIATLSYQGDLRYNYEEMSSK